MLLPALSHAIMARGKLIFVTAFNVYIASLESIVSGKPIELALRVLWIKGDHSSYTDNTGEQVLLASGKVGQYLSSSWGRKPLTKAN